MTITLEQLGIFAATILVMVAMPGLVNGAVAARSLTAGFRAGATMAFGANLGDASWALAAILGLGWVAASYAGALVVLKFVGAAWLAAMGLALIARRGPRAERVHAGRRWHCLGTGLMLGLGNPVTGVFYIALFPGFFDVTRLTPLDAAAIVGTIVAVGLACDLTYAGAAGKMGRLAGGALARPLDRAIGGALCCASLAILAR